MSFSSLLQREQPIQSGRNHWHAEPCGEESYSSAERSDAAVACEFTFRKYEDTPPTVDQIAGERKTLAEPGLQRQGVDVEERDCQEVLRPFEQTRKKSEVGRGIAHRFEALSVHRYGEAAPQARR